MKKIYIVPALAIVSIIALIFVGPIPQDQNYHHFAVERTFFSVPNFLNVITNLPFALVGLMGVRVATRTREQELEKITITLFAGFLLLTLGSGYYHLRPNNESLVYDRLPIVVILMSFFSFIIYDRISYKKGYTAFILLNVAGILSVIYWIMTEHLATGDLRWYGKVQFFPLIAIPLILSLYKSSFKYGKDIVFIFLFFGLAKFSEMFDADIYKVLNNTISGHSLKHLFMTAAGAAIVIIIRRYVKTNQVN